MFVGLTITDRFSDLLNTGYDKAKELAGYTIKIISDIPSQMQSNPNVAVGVITVANTICFLTVNAIANRLEKHFDRPNPSLANRVIKHIVIDGLLVGGAVLGLNMLLSMATPLSPFVLVAFSVSAIAMHKMSWNYTKVKSELSATKEQLKSVSEQMKNEQSTKDKQLSAVEQLKNELSAKEKELNAVSEQLKTVGQAKGSKQDQQSPEINKKNCLKELKAALIIKKTVKQWIKKWKVKKEASKGDIPDVPIAPLIIDEPVEKNFQGEPEQPNIKTLSSKTKKEDIQSQLAEVKKYIENLKAGVKPIEDDLNRLDTLQKEISEVEKELIPIRKNIENNKAMLAILKDSNTEVCHLHVQTSNSSSPMPFYSSAKFKEINTQLLAQGFTALPSKYLKSEQIKVLNDKNEYLIIDENEYEQKIQQNIQEIEKLKTKTNNGISFNEFRLTYQFKKTKLAKWQSIANDHELRIKKLEKPQVVVAEPSKVNPLTAFIQNHPELELDAWWNLQQNQNTAILVKQKAFQEYLVAKAKN